eukprot:3857040-Prymnesium_polylepis.1
MTPLAPSVIGAPSTQSRRSSWQRWQEWRRLLASSPRASGRAPMRAESRPRSESLPPPRSLPNATRGIFGSAEVENESTHCCSSEPPTMRRAQRVSPVPPLVSFRLPSSGQPRPPGSRAVRSRRERSRPRVRVRPSGLCKSRRLCTCP